MKKKSYNDALNSAKLELKHKNYNEFETDALELMLYVVGLDYSNFMKVIFEEMPMEKFLKYRKLISKRLLGETVDNILGYKYFWKSKFLVNKNVLSPRKDTEILIESILKKIYNPKKILDLCTGSGCIIISLLNEYKGSYGIGVDISKEAILIANKNADLNGVKNNLTMVSSNMYEKILNKFDLIVCNPPYIPSKDIQKLDNDVKNYDPKIALDGGPDGLDFYKYLSKNSKKYLTEGGFICLEFGYGQKEDVVSIFEVEGYFLINVSLDLNGIERSCIFKYSN